MYRMSTTIYKITSTAGDKVYIGSTTQKLKYRFTGHLTNSCSVHILFKEYGVDTCTIEAIEEVKNEERLVREKYWIEHYRETAVNINRPIRTKEEQLQQMRDHYQQNKEAHYQYSKTSYEKHKERRNKETIICECGVETTKVNISRHIKTKTHLSKVSLLSK